ncbi:MAG: hypothetical protein KKA62_01170 [Nanoarchaeota archaeon]|nr:hypothetical protein [Nanoarchaeota archaeon]MBU1976546.1 hypothetical protein [Nanoarchaeota archaeon]
MRNPPWETNWYHLKDSFLLELKDDLLSKIINKAKSKADNLFHLSKELNLSCTSFYNYVNKGEIKMISVMKLKKLLDYLDIDYNYVNDKIIGTRKGKVMSIENPRFPINLANPDGAYLLGLIVSDGCIYIDKKARGQLRTKYAAGEKESAYSILNSLYTFIHVQ